jgi:phosphoribosylamine--glycine ligase
LSAYPSASPHSTLKTYPHYQFTWLFLLSHTSAKTTVVASVSVRKGSVNMNFLVISIEGLSGDIAWQLTKEGHSVRVYIKETTDANNGFFEKISRWQRFVDWADVVLFDDIGFGQVADALRKKGKLVVGGSSYTDRLEEDRAFAHREMQSYGIPTLPQWEFHHILDAIRFLRTQPGRYVLKPCGNTPSHMKDLLIVSEDEAGRDLEAFLNKNKRLLSRWLRRFQLQEHARGVEVATGLFFNGSDFVLPLNINFEYKRLFPGDLGPFTGEMGTLMYWSNSSCIFDLTLARMKRAFKKSGYVGYLDLNCIVNAKGIFPLEFTCRFGYPTISVQMEGFACNLGEFLYSLARGHAKRLDVQPGYYAGVVVAVPPFPFEDRTRLALYRDLPIIFRVPNPAGIHLGDAKLRQGQWHTNGQSGYVVVVTGSGPTVARTLRQVRQRVRQICLPGKFYRNDIGERWQRESRKLLKWGFLAEPM